MAAEFGFADLLPDVRKVSDLPGIFAFDFGATLLSCGSAARCADGLRPSGDNCLLNAGLRP